MSPVCQIGEDLIERRHDSAPVIGHRINDLMRKWDQLLKESNNRGKGLEEARDILRFNEEVEKAETWMREKVGG